MQKKTLAFLAPPFAIARFGALLHDVIEVRVHCRSTRGKVWKFGKSGTV